MSRQSTFSPELAELICEKLSFGQSLVSICNADDMPSRTTVANWLVKAENGNEEYKPFLDSYVRAREAQADSIFDECLQIADESGADAVVDKETGQIRVDGEVIARAKLRIETRMRMAGKLKPKKYGDKIAFEGEVKHKFEPLVIKGIDG